MARKKSGKRRTPEPLIPLVSDGLHFVREASPKDQHPMRFVIDQHKKVEHLPRFSTLPRHCASLEDGKELVDRYTKRACEQSPELKQAFESARTPVKPEPAPPPPPPPVPVQRVRKQRPPKQKKVEFPITRFTCVMANPVAQVWVCTKDKWETIGVGRRSNSGVLAKLDELKHEKGDFAVLQGADPLLDESGQVRVFHVLQEASAMIETLYSDAPADEHISNNMNTDRPTTTVYQNLSYSVHFDPSYNGAKQPFNIFDTNNYKVVRHPRGDFPLKFRIITSAIKEADRLDKLRRGL